MSTARIYMMLSSQQASGSYARLFGKLCAVLCAAHAPFYARRTAHYARIMRVLCAKFKIEAHRESENSRCASILNFPNFFTIFPFLEPRAPLQARPDMRTGAAQRQIMRDYARRADYAIMRAAPNYAQNYARIIALGQISTRNSGGPTLAE